MTKTEKGEETMSRKLRKKILGDSLIWVIIAAFVVIMLFPFVYILSTALKCRKDLTESGTVGEFYKSMAAAGFS